MLNDIATITAVVTTAFVTACGLAILIRNQLTRAGMGLDAEVKGQTIHTKFIDA